MSRMKKTHAVPISPVYFEAIRTHRKNFDYRHNTENFRVGDTLFLQEWDEEKGYSGRELTRIVGWMLLDGGGWEGSLPSGYCIMSLLAPERDKDAVLATYESMKAWDDIKN